jgi:hypothetical protein
VLYRNLPGGADKKCKVAHVHAVKTMGRAEISLHVFLTSGLFIFGIRTPLSIEWEAWCATEPFWTFRKREKPLSSVGSRIPFRTACSLIAIPTMIYDFHSRTVHLDIVKVFIYQLMHKRVALKEH